MRRRVLLCGVVVLLQAIVLHAESTGAVDAGGDLEVLELDGDVVIDNALTVENRHVRIRGNLILAEGGELTLKNCHCELLCNYAREFIYEWRGGVLRT